MYESPIQAIHSDMEIAYENECLKAVQRVGFDVNKEELLRALQYDRGQYLVGYQDGYVDAIDEFASELKEVFKYIGVVSPVIDELANKFKRKRGNVE